MPYEQDQVCKDFVLVKGAATLEEIAVAVGLTRERVRQIEAAALRKIRRICAQDGIAFGTLMAYWKGEM